MADMKVLNVTLSSDAELKALTGEKRPRRPRSTRKQRGGATSYGPDASPESGRVQDIGGSLSPMEAAVAEGAVARIEKIDSVGVPVGTQAAVSGEARGAPLMGGGGGIAPLGDKPNNGTVPTSLQVSPLAAGLTGTPSVIRASMSTTSTVGGAAPSPVVIGGKRGAPIVSTSQITRILPTKRRLTEAPAAITRKKQNFKIGGGGTNEQPGNTEPVQGGSVSGGARSAAPAAKQTRRFKERKIKLTVKSSRVSKAIRHKVKARVLAMPVDDVRKLLLEKGIIKAAAADKLPEEMLRNMLRDYMLLHNAD